MKHVRPEGRITSRWYCCGKRRRCSAAALIEPDCPTELPLPVPGEETIQHSLDLAELLRREGVVRLLMRLAVLAAVVLAWGAPRVLALFFLMPCLSTVANLAAIFASSLICYAYFSIAWVYFLDLVKDALLIRDIITGVLKSFMFGLLIASIACYRGLSVKGGASGVGTATTSSVVTAITTVIGFDTVYNVVYVIFFP